MIRRRIATFDTLVSGVVDGWPRSLKPVMQVATFLGEPGVVSLLCVAAAWLAWQEENRPLALGIVAALVASGANVALKQFFQRPRPNTIYVANMRFKTHSFPSGHAFAGVAIYGLFAYVAAAYVLTPWGFVAAIIMAAVSLLVGLSRIYLGAHYPTDVLAGWILGSATLLVIVLATF